MALTQSIGPSGDQRIDGLLRSRKWIVDVTYSDPQRSQDYSYFHDGNNNGISVQYDNFSSLTSVQLQSVHATLSVQYPGAPAGNAGFSVEGFTELGVEYLSESGSAMLRYANSADPRTAYCWYPGETERGGDSWYNGSGDNPVVGNYDYFTFLHETGHALGLKHGHDPSVFGALPLEFDSHEYSLMTYRSYQGSPGEYYTNEFWGGPQTYMMFDIAALQYMYGADFQTRAEDTTYKWRPDVGETLVNGDTAIAPGGNRIFLTIWDGGGTDTYDFSAYSTDISVDLRPGFYSTLTTEQIAYLGGGSYANGNIYNALQYEDDPRSLIENAQAGGGDDLVVGNAADNQLFGGEGADTVRGGRGEDRLFGEDGNDHIDGGGGADHMEGGRGEDKLFGEDGDDHMDGGRGADHMEGGLGNDVYIVDHAGDLVIERPFAGSDEIIASVSYTLPDHVGILTLSGNDKIAGLGNSLDNRISGNEADNQVSGFGGADKLFGNGGDDLLDGGAGADELYGGSGDDVYIVDHAGDLVIERPFAGSDKIISSVSYTLPDHVGILKLSGPDRIAGRGNNLNNRISGNDADNQLSGFGGADRLFGNDGDDWLDGGPGADELNGGSGDDVFIVDHAGDLVIERAFGGSDEVRASISYKLPEHVRLLALTGSAAIDGDGNELDNRITGNDANNRLSGHAGTDHLTGAGGDDILDGGTGADRMEGGAGNDTYFLDNLADTLIEAEANGIDQVVSSITTILPEHFEDLTLVGADRIDGRGNELANKIIGNAAANKLYGKAGKDRIEGLAGNDKLYGGDANDRLYGGSGHDRLSGGDNRDKLYGGDGRDTLYGKDGKDILKGGDSSDKLYGGDAADRLHGQSGNDILKGGAGIDRLFGGSGQDALFGGDDNDTFVFEKLSDSLRGKSRDVIEDMTRSSDVIDLSQIDANSVRPGNQRFKYIGTEQFTGKAGELRMKKEVLRADVDGDGRSDFEITVSEIYSLAATDIML